MRRKNHLFRLPAYTKVAVGSAAAVSAVGTMEAAVVYFDVNPDRTILDGNSLTFGSINLAAGTYSLAGGTAPYFTLSSNGVGPIFSGYPIEAAAALGLNLVLFPYGSSISGDVPFAAGTYSAGYWGAGDSGYIGLRIDLTDGDYNYGWAHVSVADPATSITITGFAFETDVNTPIAAGAIPEPSTYALLVLAGLFGAAVWHHRRQKVGAPTELLQLAAGARGVEQLRSSQRSEK